MTSLKDKWGIIGVLFLILFLSISLVSAHQPRLVDDQTSISNPIMVQNPEVSQAFYGQLQGSPAYYEINSNKSFRLYVNILVPDTPGSSEQLMSVEILNESGNRIALLDAQNSSWDPYFEEFGGDNYLRGSEFNQTQEAGKYYIKVFNENNRGRYSLVVGEEETFPPGEALNALILLPILKSNIFQVPVAELFIQFLGIILAMGVFLVIYVFIIKSRKSAETLELTRKVYGAVNPLLLIGLAITTIMWLYAYSKNTFNILGGVTTLLLIILLLLHWNVNSKLKKISLDNLPAKISTIILLFWIIFLFLRIVLIQS